MRNKCSYIHITYIKYTHIPHMHICTTHTCMYTYKHTLIIINIILVSVLMMFESLHLIYMVFNKI